MLFRSAPRTHPVVDGHENLKINADLASYHAKLATVDKLSLTKRITVNYKTLEEEKTDEPHLPSRKTAFQAVPAIWLIEER